jgi:hypothetical protein
VQKMRIAGWTLAKVVATVGLRGTREAQDES